MLLILKIQTYCHQPVSKLVECRLSGVGGTLGRAVENDLVLDDPGKLISRIHAKVSFQAGSYVLEDVGSNPSIVNDQPLGKGKEITLSHGDRIVIGDYQLEVRLENIQVMPLPIVPSPFNNPALPLFIQPPITLTPSLPLPDFAKSNIASFSPPAFHDALAGAKILDIKVGSNKVLVADADFGAAVYDPLGLNPFSKAVSVQIPPQFAPLFAADSGLISPKLSAVVMPTLAPVVDSLTIPDDYDPLADFFTPTTVVASVSAPTVGMANTANVVDATDTIQVEPASTPFSLLFVPPSLKAADLLIASEAVSGSSALIGINETQDSAMLQALLRGLGLPDLKLTGSAVSLAETVGAMLREATSGTMDLLTARSLTKKESRVDMTMISIRSNNPLKFFPDSESAMTQLLTNAMAGYLPAVPAVEGAFVDLQAHELAVLAGMRAALAAVLHRFNPAQIELQMALPTMMDKMLSANRKARMWERLVELYGEIVSDADDDLQRLFGEQFSAAYEDQVKRLRPM